ncbi:MAG: DUF6134 family protein [Alphaproteobacteria bacterium]|nr:DUF6134 family protein [Alphaproteobacteria bacterium]
MMRNSLICFGLATGLIAGAALANDEMLSQRESGGVAFEALTASQLEPVVPDSQLINFDVYRKNSKIGTHRFSFIEKEDEIEVSVDIDLEVDFLFITVFDYEHRIREFWKGGELVRLESETKQNSKTWDVEAETSSGDFVVNVEKGKKNKTDEVSTLRFDQAHIPTSYWNIELLRADKLFNTQTGELLEVEISEAGYETVEAQGRMVEAVKVTIRGELEVDLWYDRRGELVKLAFSANDGSRVEYKRI